MDHMIRVRSQQKAVDTVQNVLLQIIQQKPKTRIIS